MRYFSHLAEVLSYTKAAKDLYIAQPTLSAAIRQLEKEIGLQLFERSAGSSHVVVAERQDLFFANMLNLQSRISIQVFV